MLAVELAAFACNVAQTSMTKTRMELPRVLDEHYQGGFLRGIARAILLLIMESDADSPVGAGRHERSGARATGRKGEWQTDSAVKTMVKRRNRRLHTRYRSCGGMSIAVACNDHSREAGLFKCTLNAP